jgi:hypothetical protein
MAEVADLPGSNQSASATFAETLRHRARASIRSADRPTVPKTRPCILTMCSAARWGGFVGRSGAVFLDQALEAMVGGLAAQVLIPNWIPIWAARPHGHGMLDLNPARRPSAEQTC